jgi:hypothetical protein
MRARARERKLHGMTSTAHIEAPASYDAPVALHDSDEPLAGLPPLLTRVPVAGPPVWAIVAFGLMLLFLLVPPFALVVTLMGAFFLIVLAVGAVLALIGAILVSPFVIARHLRELRLPRFRLTSSSRSRASAVRNASSRPASTSWTAG